MGAEEVHQVPPAAEDGYLGELLAAFCLERDANVEATQSPGPTGRTGLDALLLALTPNRLQQLQMAISTIEAGQSGDSFEAADPGPWTLDPGPWTGRRAQTWRRLPGAKTWMHPCGDWR